MQFKFNKTTTVTKEKETETMKETTEFGISARFLWALGVAVPAIIVAVLQI
ncbi:hypothetical protein [Metabacillus fastidiosus]|uniref:hypothetical protein n=1 Tax=Metabacillus fastidiosus TaxID=1458 RepID=UPI003D2E1ADC